MLAFLALLIAASLNMALTFLALGPAASAATSATANHTPAPPIPSLRRPPRGWNSWNAFHRNISSSLFRAHADALLSLHLADSGYDTVATDGGWWQGADTGTIHRNASGFMSEDPAKFPEGMQALVDYVHSRGLKWGHYTDAGKYACNGDAPMSEGFEAQDAALFVGWGADMLKVDACSVVEPAETVMIRWAQLLTATGRPVVLSDCHNGCMNDPRFPKQQWAPWCTNTVNMWRTSADIAATWSSMLSNLDTLKGMGARAGPHAGYNDPDFLECGIGEFAWPGAGPGAAAALRMNQAHFALWAVTSAPLILGFDLRVPAPELVELVSNSAALRVNAAYAGNTGDFIRNVSLVELWAKPLGNGTAAAVVLNRATGSNPPVAFEVRLGELPGLPPGVTSCLATEVWGGAAERVTAYTPSVPPQAAAFAVFSSCE